MEFDVYNKVVYSIIEWSCYIERNKSATNNCFILIA